MQPMIPPPILHQLLSGIYIYLLEIKSWELVPIITIFRGSEAIVEVRRSAVLMESCICGIL